MIYLAESSHTLQVKDAASTASDVSFKMSFYLQGIRDQLTLSLTIVSEDDPGKRSKSFDLRKSKPSPYKRDDANEAGTLFQVDISLPQGFKPGTPLALHCLDSDPVLFDLQFWLAWILG